MMTDVTAGAWDIDEGIRDAERFFALLPSMFPTATLFWDALIKRGTVWASVASRGSCASTGFGPRP